MAKVDPFVIQWPSKWMADGEIRPVIEYLNRYLHDMFIRSGGGNDLLSDLSNESGVTSIGMLSNLSKRLADLEEESNSIAMLADLSKRLTDLEAESNNIAMLASVVKSVENIKRTSTTFDMGLVSSIMESTFDRRYALLVS